MKIFIAFVVMISCTVAANLMMKSGAMVPVHERFILGLLSWKSLIGLCVFAIAALIYAWLLQWVPLNVAQSFAAAQFIAVILASAWVLSEGISLSRWIGILLIATGILVVGLTTDFEPDQGDIAKIEK
ncbi:MAG: hypothetical protein AAF495_00095 [Pseudomonadota bacterium]